MADKEERIYVGKGKTIKYGQIKFGLKLEDLKKVVNERGYVNLIMAPMKQDDNYGNSHTIFVDTWKPEGGQAQTRSTKPAPASSGKNDDLPFVWVLPFIPTLWQALQSLCA